MPHLLERRDSAGNGLALWVLAAMAFVAPFAWWSVKQVRLENNVKNWLPEDDPGAEVLEWYEEHFSREERLLISWRDAAIDDPRIPLLARQLGGFVDEEGIRRDGSPFISRVLTHEQALSRMRRFDVPREEALDRLTGVLIGQGPLRLRLTDIGRENVERTKSLVANALREELGLEVSFLEPAVNFNEYELPPAVAERFPPEEEPEEDEEPVLLPVPEDAPAPEDDIEPYEPFDSWSEHDLRVTWRGLHASRTVTDEAVVVLERLEDRGDLLVASAHFTPGAPVAVAAVITPTGRESRKEMFVEIDAVAAEVGIPPEDLRIGGDAYVGHELNGYLKKVVFNADAPPGAIHQRSPFLASLIVGVVLSFVMLRSIRLATVVLISAIYTMLITVALVPVTGGSMNVVLVVMPTLLMVLTLSAAIHVCHYWRHAVATGSREPVVDAAKAAHRPCIYAALTTAIGLLSLWTSPLTPVRDFGFYSAVGCVLLTGVVLLGMTSLMQFWRGRPLPPEEHERHGWWHWFGGWLGRHAVAVSLVSLVAFVGSVYGLRWFHTETKAIKYFPDDAKVVRDYNFLEDQLAGVISVEFLVRFDDARVDSDSPSEESTKTFLDRLEVVRAVQRKLETHPDITGTISLATFLPVIERPPADASRSEFVRWNLTSTRIERRLKGDDADSAGSLFNAASETIDLPTGFGGEMRIAEGDELFRVAAYFVIMNDTDFAELVGDPRTGRVGSLNELVRDELRRHPSAAHLVTGMVPLFLRTQQAVLDSLITSFVLAFAIIAVVMMGLLRSVTSGALAMLPNLLPVGVVFGLVAWAGIPIDIGTMITASVALGIAVDGTLHLLTWFQNGLERGLSREEAVAEALAHCGPAMFQTSTVVGCGLLVLASAELLLIHRFGWLMASLIGAALVADVVLLPALLAGPLGRLVKASVTRRMAAAKQDGESEVPDGVGLRSHAGRT